MRRFLFYIIIWSFSSVAFCQIENGYSYPATFETSLFSQAQQGFYWQGFDSTKTTLHYFRKQFLSSFSEISQNDIGYIHQISKNEISLNIYSEQEGKHIDRNRLYLGYARFLQLSSKYKSCLRAHIGGISYVYDDSPNSQTFSDFGLDANASFSIFSNSEVLILQVHHLPQSQIQPRAETIKFHRYLQFYFAKKLIINPYFKFKIETSGRLYPNQYNDYYLSPYLMWNDVIQGCIGLSRTGILNIGVGIKIYKDLHFLISYNEKTTWTLDTENVQKIELGLVYKKF